MFRRYGHYQYDSSHSNYSPTVQSNLYNDTYSHLESPEKVSSLDRNKKLLLQSQINTLDSAVYGTTNSYGQNNQDPTNYNSFSKNAPRFTPSSATPARPPPPANYAQESKVYSPTSTPPQYTPYKQLPTATSASPKYLGNSSFDYSPPTKPDNQISFLDQKPSSLGDGYSTSEYQTNTYKIPGGYKTDSYKYESYQSSSQPTYSSVSEKYYTSTPNSKLQISPFDKKSFETFSNGTNNQYQSSFSSNVEYVNEPPVLKDTDTLEQKMLKKSLTQQIIEKKTVQMTKSSKQETSTKRFGFE